VWLLIAVVSLILVGGASWVVWALSQFGDHGASPEEFLQIENRTEDTLVIYERQDDADDEPSEVRVNSISPVSVIRTECPVNVIVARTIEGQIVSTREPGVHCNVDWIIEFSETVSANAR
jgi:hypothetical protein